MGWSDLPSDLPSDLVISIAARLSEAGDYARFRAVCRSWESSLVRGRNFFRPSFSPWLAVIPGRRDPKRGELSFISHVANDRIYKRSMPCDKFSSHVSNINKDGWMVFLLKEDRVAVIVNPVTGAQLPSIYNCLHHRIHYVFLADNLFAFVVHHTEDSNLILTAAAPGDGTWSVVHSCCSYFNNIEDVVFHETDPKFYAVDRDLKLLAFCLTRCGGKTVVGEVSTLCKGTEKSGWEGGLHLVSCGSNLLLVRDFYLYKDKFEILKYCPDADEWIGMTNLDLGKNSLFISSYGACSRGAKLLPISQGDEGRLRRNCIYFIYYQKILPPDQLAWEEEEERNFISVRHARIYDACKGVEEPCFFVDINSDSDSQYNPILLWFTPSLSINH